jgi:hypothetical protein
MAASTGAARRDHIASLAEPAAGCGPRFSYFLKTSAKASAYAGRGNGSPSGTFIMSV